MQEFSFLLSFGLGLSCAPAQEESYLHSQTRASASMSFIWKYPIHRYVIFQLSQIAQNRIDMIVGSQNAFELLRIFEE